LLGTAFLKEQKKEIIENENQRNRTDLEEFGSIHLFLSDSPLCRSDQSSSSSSKLVLHQKCAGVVAKMIKL